MRNIRFRGFAYNKWVFGDLVHIQYDKELNSKSQIAIFTDNGQANIVNTETVGQYTGLRDKNGTKIFEGDIVNISDFDGGHKIGEVVYNDGACCYRIWGDLFDYGLGIYQDDNIEVIGNIYDNPELLEG